MAKQKRRGLLVAIIIVAAVVLLPIAGVGVFAVTYDTNHLKPRIAAAIRQATGRAVTLDGPIRIGLSLRPTLQVNDVVLANAPGFARPAMVTLDQVNLRLALLPLLHRKIEIAQLDLVHPVIALQVDAQGHDNWHFQPASLPATQPVPSGAVSAGPRARQLSLQVETMRVQDGTIIFDDARNGAAFTLHGVQLTATQGTPDGPIHLDADATAASVPLAVSGDVGSPRAQFMPIDMTLKASGSSVTVKGTAPQFAVAGHIPDLAALSALAGSRLPSLHDVSFQADVAPVSGSIATGVALHGLRITGPHGDVAGNATITLASPASVQATLAVQNLDPAALYAALPAPEAATVPAAPAQAVPAAPAVPTPPPASPSPPSRNWLIPDRALPFALLPKIDADLTMTFQNTKVGAATIKSASTHAVLRGGHLTLDPLSIDFPGGHVDATAMADRGGAAALTLRAPSLAVQPLLAAFNEPDGIIGTLEVRAQLQGNGATAHAFAAGLDGGVGLALVNGEIDNRLLVALLSRVAPEAGLLDLAGKAGRSSLRCVALRADVTHGVADLKALLLDTVPLRLTGDGSANLAQETLALRLQPLARIGGTGLTVPVDVRGSFRSPHLAMDTSGSGKASALAGLVIGALGRDRLIAGAGQSDGCAEQLQAARFGQSGPVPAALPAQEAGKAKPQNLNDLLKRLLR